MVLTCPICDGGCPTDDAPGSAPGKLSEWDGSTEICLKCSHAEAFTSRDITVWRGHGIPAGRRQIRSWLEWVKAVRIMRAHLSGVKT